MLTNCWKIFPSFFYICSFFFPEASCTALKNPIPPPLEPISVLFPLSSVWYFPLSVFSCILSLVGELSSYIITVKLSPGVYSNSHHPATAHSVLFYLQSFILSKNTITTQGEHVLTPYLLKSFLTFSFPKAPEFSASPTVIVLTKNKTENDHQALLIQ